MSQAAKTHPEANGERQVAVNPNGVDTIVSDWVTLKVLADPQTTFGKNMSAVSLFFGPGHGHGRHNHPEAEQIIYMISGQAEMMIEFETGKPQKKVINPGDLVYIPQGVYHSTYNVGWEPVRILAVYSPPGPESGMRYSEEFITVPAGETAKIKHR